MSSIERFFFGQDSQRMFGALSKPSARAHTGLVLCPPLGEEMVATYARLARWTKELADIGFLSLRYHACGTGESDGSARDFKLTSAGRDAASAVRWIRENSDVKRVGILGLRFGGSAAVLSCAGPDFMILWSPIVDLRTYFRDLLRARIAKDMVHLRDDRVRVTTKDLISELEAGRCIDLLGYETSPEFYREMMATSWPIEPPSAEVLWLGLPREQAQADAVASTWKQKGCRVDTQMFREHVFWEDFSADFPHQFAASSIAWMERTATRVSA